MGLGEAMFPAMVAALAKDLTLCRAGKGLPADVQGDLYSQLILPACPKVWIQLCSMRES